MSTRQTPTLCSRPILGNVYYSLLFKELPYLLAGCTMYGTIFCTCQIFCTDPDLYRSSGFESYLQIAVIETIVAIFLILSSDHMKKICT
jgi:hypothetical protein